MVGVLGELCRSVLHLGVLLSELRCVLTWHGETADPR